MKIAFVLPASGSVPVGGYKIIYEYANRLSRTGFDVSVVHPARLYIDTPLVEMPKKIVRYVQRRFLGNYRPSSWFKVDDQVKLLWRFSLQENGIPDSDVVVASSWQTAEWVKRYGDRKGRKIYFIQDYEHFMTARDEIRQRICATFKYGMCNIVISPACSDMVEECGAEVDAYIPNGIDFDVFYPIYGIADTNRDAIGFPCRSESYKGTRDAIAALEIVRNKVGKELKIWSFGGRRPDYMPKWVTYYERPSDQKLCELYSATSVFVTASHYEGWGLPGAEAMACGAALVSTEHGGVRAYATHEQTALLSAPGDIEKLALNVERLIRDQSFREEIALAGHRNIRQFTWETSVDTFCEVLWSITAQKNE